MALSSEILHPIYIYIHIDTPVTTCITQCSYTTTQGNMNTVRSIEKSHLFKGLKDTVHSDSVTNHWIQAHGVKVFAKNKHIHHGHGDQKFTDDL